MVQPRKTRPYITERLLMGRKESNQTNKQTLKGMAAQLSPRLVLTYTCVYSVSVKLIDLPFLQLVQIKYSSTITFKNKLACLKSKFLTKHAIVCCNYPRKCTKYAPRREKTRLRWFWEKHSYSRFRKYYTETCYR